MGVAVRPKVKGIGNPWGEQAMTRRSEISSTRGWLYLAARLLETSRRPRRDPAPWKSELKGGWWGMWPAGPCGDYLGEGAKPLPCLEDD
jgi:hypothetical protein